MSAKLVCLIFCSVVQVALAMYDDSQVDENPSSGQQSSEVTSTSPTPSHSPRDHGENSSVWLAEAARNEVTLVSAAQGSVLLQALQDNEDIDHLVALTLQRHVSAKNPNDDDADATQRTESAESVGLTDPDAEEEPYCMICGVELDTSQDTTLEDELLRMSWRRCKSGSHWCCRRCWQDHICAGIEAGKVCFALHLPGTFVLVFECMICVTWHCSPDSSLILSCLV